MCAVPSEWAGHACQRKRLCSLGYVIYCCWLWLKEESRWLIFVDEQLYSVIEEDNNDKTNMTLERERDSNRYFKVSMIHTIKLKRTKTKLLPQPSLSEFTMNVHSEWKRKLDDKEWMSRWWHLHETANLSLPVVSFVCLVCRFDDRDRILSWSSRNLSYNSDVREVN